MSALTLWSDVQLDVPLSVLDISLPVDRQALMAFLLDPGIAWTAAPHALPGRIAWQAAAQDEVDQPAHHAERRLVSGRGGLDVLVRPAAQAHAGALVEASQYQPQSVGRHLQRKGVRSHDCGRRGGRMRGAEGRQSRGVRGSASGSEARARAARDTLPIS
jgi:hypothetical protein